MKTEKLIVMRVGDNLYADESSPKYSENLKEVKRIYENVFVLSSFEDKAFYWIGKIFYYSFLLVGMVSAGGIVMQPIYNLITK